MSSLNKIVLIGSIKDTPDVKATTSENVIGKFTLEVDRPNTQVGMAQKDHFQVVAWGELANTIGQTASQGATALVEGRISTRTYEDAEGNRKYATEIEAREFKVLSGTPSIPLESPVAASPLTTKADRTEIKESDFQFDVTDTSTPSSSSFDQEELDGVPF